MEINTEIGLKSNHEFFTMDYEYLRPDTNTLVGRTEGLYNESDKRNFFYNIEISEEEKTNMNEFEERLKQEKLLEIIPRSWSQYDSLRMVYTNKYVLNDAIVQLKKQCDWFKSLKEFSLTDGAATLLRDGHVFIGPRDKSNNPSLWVIFGNLKMSTQLADDFSNAMLFCSMIMRKYMMVPGHFDKFTAIFDLCQRNVMMLKPPLIIKIMTCFKDIYNGFSAKSIVFNSTFSFNLIWKGVSTVISADQAYIGRLEDLWLPRINKVKWPWLVYPQKGAFLTACSRYS